MLLKMYQQQQISSFYIQRKDLAKSSTTATACASKQSNLFNPDDVKTLVETLNQNVTKNTRLLSSLDTVPGMQDGSGRNEQSDESLRRLFSHHCTFTIKSKAWRRSAQPSDFDNAIRSQSTNIVTRVTAKWCKLSTSSQNNWTVLPLKKWTLMASNTPTHSIPQPSFCWWSSQSHWESAAGRWLLASLLSRLAYRNYTWSSKGR